VDARSRIDVETCWSEAVPKVVQDRAGGHFLPIVVALARRITVETRWSTDLPVVVPGGTAMGKTRMSAAAREQALRMGAGFFVGSTDTFLDKAMQ